MVGICGFCGFSIDILGEVCYNEVSSFRHF